jgi:hypothetical protein
LSHFDLVALLDYFVLNAVLGFGVAHYLRCLVLGAVLDSTQGGNQNRNKNNYGNQNRNNNFGGNQNRNKNKFNKKGIAILIAAKIIVTVLVAIIVFVAILVAALR